jgi:putative membrane protein
MYKLPYTSKLFCSPLFALFAFAILFFIYHLQMTLQMFSQYPLIHTGYMLLLFYLSFLMWWPLLSPQYKRKKNYAFKSSLLIMPACFYFIIAGVLGGISGLPLHTELNATLCLPSDYTPADLLPFPFNSRMDQLMAGILMMGMHKLGQSITLHDKKAT